MSRIILVFLAVFFCASSSVFAADDFDMSDFSVLAVLEQGRVKPLESFARTKLKQISGRETIEGLSAAEWLAETLFDPAQALGKPVFIIRNKDLKRRLALPETQKFFAFAALQAPLQKSLVQLEPLLTMENSERTREQNDLLELHENAIAYMKLLRSFSQMLPLNIVIPETYKDSLTDEPPTYMALQKIEKEVMDDVRSLKKQKGEDPETYTEDGVNLATLAFYFQQMRAGGENNDVFKVIPVSWAAEQGEWVSPWTLMLEGYGSPESTKTMELWENLANAYRKDDQEGWRKASSEIVQYNKGYGISPSLFRLENFYYAIKPFYWAICLYNLCLVLLLAGFFKPVKLLENAALVSLGAGATIHAGAILSRILILERAPVGTLYESVLFVSLICAAVAFFMTLRSRNPAVLTSGTLSAMTLLTLAPVFAKQGESMDMLVAVLNTNFWLSTHVICVTTGYALCILTACLAHGELAFRALNKPQNLQPNLYKSTLAALLFMAVGTALGGIWADQSWGRFWGWDPKENGALLIVLWLIWALHGRISDRLSDLSFAAALAFLNAIVALSWFGVNLLNTGLHSYGFTSGTATGLGLFCALEAAVIGFLWFRAKGTAVHAS